MVLSRDLADGHPTRDIEWRLSELREHADVARTNLAEIDTLPAAEAAQLIRAHAAQAEAARIAEAARLARAAEHWAWDSPARVHPTHPAPSRGLSL